MGRSKKEVKRINSPTSREVRFAVDPDTIYKQKATWTFTQCDTEGRWAFTKENIGDEFWTRIFPYLKSIGLNTWNEILLMDKKRNHTIQVDKLNKCAQERLKQLNIICDEVISLHLTGCIRIYGIWQMATCSILWYDTDHGDNDTCVCRSALKHT